MKPVYVLTALIFTLTFLAPPASANRARVAKQKTIKSLVSKHNGGSLKASSISYRTKSRTSRVWRRALGPGKSKSLFFTAKTTKGKKVKGVIPVLQLSKKQIVYDKWSGSPVVVRESKAPNKGSLSKFPKGL
jgi:hypothetical protein